MMSSLNLPYVIYKSPQKQGSKNGVFYSFFAPKSSLNHYILWSISTLCHLNHNTSSELYSQRALNAQTYPPFLCIFMRFAVIFSRYIHNCRIYLHKYYVIIFIASRVRCRNGHYLIFVEHVNVSFVNKHFLSLTVIKIT